MLIKFPKDDSRFQWTRHIKGKMLYYGLSEQRIRRVLASPNRIETGVAKDTLAAMQTKKGRKTPEEIWVMYQIKKNEKNKLQKSPRKFLMISAWRYPGISKPGEPIPIPDDILEELAHVQKRDYV